MKKTTRNNQPALLKITAKTIIFLAVLAVFLFSLFKIITLSGLSRSAFGCSACDLELCGLIDQVCTTCCGPTNTPTSTPTGTPTSTPTATSTPTSTPTSTATSTPTITITSTPTSTPTEVPEGDPTSTPTQTPTPTPTSAPPSDEPGRGGPPQAPQCLDPAPEAPVLIQVERVNSTTLRPIWTEVAGATDYSLSYGLKPGEYLYGVPSTGKVIAYDVSSLTAGQNYCFAVRALNNCAPGPLSNEVCTQSPAGQILGASTLASTGSPLFLLQGCFVCLGLACAQKASRRLRQN